MLYFEEDANYDNSTLHWDHVKHIQTSSRYPTIKEKKKLAFHADFPNTLS